MATKLSSKGFAPVLVIGGLLIAVTLGISCYFVWQHSKENGNKTTASTSQSIQSKSSSSADKTTDPTDGGKYLYIKEWGVRFLLPQDLQSDIYYLESKNSIGLEGASFASKKLDALVGDGSCAISVSADGMPSGSGLNATLGRIDPEHPGQMTMEAYRSQSTYVGKVGSYEYYYANDTENPPITCTTENHPTQNDVETHISNELKAAFKTIETVKN